MHGSIDNQTLLAATSGGALAVREECDMSLHLTAPEEKAGDEVSIRPEFAQPGERHSVPRFRLAERMLPARTAYQLVHDELLLDANSRLNLATFVGTWMEPEARLLKTWSSR
jgi:glutamate decarboxylase